MPFDLAGNFTRVQNWQQDRDNGIRILADRHDAEDNNFANAFNQTFLRNGVVPMTGPLNMNGKKITTVAAGTEASPGLTFELSTSTGLWQANPNHLGISVNGVKKGEFTVNGFGTTGFYNGGGTFSARFENVVSAVTPGAGPGIEIGVSGTGVPGITSYNRTTNVPGPFTLNASFFGLNTTADGTKGVVAIAGSPLPEVTPAILSVTCTGVGGGAAVPQYVAKFDGQGSANGASIFYGVWAHAFQNVQGAAIGVWGEAGPSNSNTLARGVSGKAFYNSDGIWAVSVADFPTGVYGEVVNSAGTTNTGQSSAGTFENKATKGATAYGLICSTVAGALDIKPFLCLHAGSIVASINSTGVVQAKNFYQSGGNASARFENAASVGPPGTGPGVEIASTGIVAFNRTTAAYAPMSIGGSTVNTNISGTDVLFVSSTGIYIAGYGSTDAANGWALYGADPASYNFARIGTGVYIKSAGAAAVMIAGVNQMVWAASRLDIGALPTTVAPANLYWDFGGTAQVYRSTSSIKYKKDIKPLVAGTAIATLMALNPVTYTSRSPDDPQIPFYGLIAEEVAKVDPTLVTFTYPKDAWYEKEVPAEQLTEGDPATKMERTLKKNAKRTEIESVQYERLIVPLIKYIQELEARLQAAGI